MYKKILITGGAGFIGSHLCDELLANGYSVRILDNLDEQIHGDVKISPHYLSPEAELIVGDVRNPFDVSKAMKNIDVVFHFAAKVGVGQSMYTIKNYMDVNTIGTSVLMQHIINHPVEKLIVASGMSIYGEGYYRDIKGNVLEGSSRSIEQLKDGKWELYDEEGNVLQPIPTPENKKPNLASVYALSKYDQEQLCLLLGRAYNIPTVALRFFNVYGTRQALSNPYTGVLAIFASRLLNNKPPVIYEDGAQMRDFISVYDIARACRMAMENEAASNQVLNIGSGNAYSIQQIALQLAKVLNKNIAPEITKQYRAGDIRHCFADISKAQDLLGFEPKVNLSEGLSEYTHWLGTQMAKDYVEMAHEELTSRGLTV